METRVFTEYLLSLRQELTGRFLRKKALISGTLALPGGSHETE
jgi:hypothetical protein